MRVAGIAEQEGDWFLAQGCLTSSLQTLGFKPFSWESKTPNISPQVVLARLLSFIMWCSVNNSTLVSLLSVPNAFGHYTSITEKYMMLTQLMTKLHKVHRVWYVRCPCTFLDGVLRVKQPNHSNILPSYSLQQQNIIFSRLPSLSSWCSKVIKSGVFSGETSFPVEYQCTGAQ